MEAYDSLDIMSKTQPLDEMSRKKLEDIPIELNSYCIKEEILLEKKEKKD
jgi:hypothetical protein